jgi:C-terminal processing protease CtpA/Prc
VRNLLRLFILLAVMSPGATTFLARGQEIAKAPDVVDAVTRDKVIESVLQEIARSYVYPAVGTKMIESVRGRMQRHEYDTISKASELTDRLTGDLQEVSKDLHLRVEFHPEPPITTLVTPEARERFHTRQRRRNFGFEQVQRLPGNIGYVDLRTFEHTNTAWQTAATAMEFLAYTEALIIDLRNNGGGHESMCQLLASYFLSADTEDLYDAYSREDNTTSQNWSFPFVPGTRYGTKKPVYLLTSKRTFSAAETFAYTLHNRKRVTLVGETTGGGANTGFPRTVYNEHFTIWLPWGTDIDPVTKTNWESVGIKPDVEVPEALALKTAYIAALRSVLASTMDEELKEEVKKAIVSAGGERDGQNNPRRNR